MKSTKIEVEKRVTEIINLISKGYSNNRIIHYITQAWGIEERQAKIYIKKATAFLVENTIKDREEILAVQNERLLNLYESCTHVIGAEKFDDADRGASTKDIKRDSSIEQYRAGQKGIALNTLRELNKINGLHVETMQIDMRYSKLDTFLDILGEVAKEGGEGDKDA